MDNILRIDMGAAGGPSATVEPAGRYATLGGRAMTSTVIWEEVPPACDPLGPESKVVFSPGVMSGSPATTSGRLSVGCKSPLTGGLKEANTGGQASQNIARLGFCAVILEGERKSGDLYKVVIDKNGVQISLCNEHRMLGNYALAEKIKDEHGDKVAMISIGPAGEQGLSVASVAVTDPEFHPTRHAARSGVGAVMGAKGIKVIVADPKGTARRQPVDPVRFMEANRKMVQTLKAAEYTGALLPTFGTAFTGDITNEMGCYPALNCTSGRYEDYSKISAEALITLEKERGGAKAPTHGCHTGCQIKCSGTFNDKDGKFLSKQPESGTIWATGGYCGITDLDTIARIDRLCDDLGVDTIDMGISIGVLMQVGELEQGNGDAALALVAEIGKGTEKGKLIGSGAASVAKHYGFQRAPVVKGQAMAAYDPRALKGIGVTYATSTQAAGHTAGNHLGKAEPFVDALASEGQWMASAIARVGAAAFDATGYCLFLGLASLDKPEVIKYLLDSMSAFTGTNYNETSFATLGMRILRMERDFNLKAGLTEEDDRLPEWMTKGHLPPYNSVFDVTEAEMQKVHNHIGLMLAKMEGVTMAFSPPMAVFGEGVHKKVPDNLASLGVTKPLIVTDKGVVQVGLFTILTDAIEAKFMPYALYDGTEPNPTVENVYDAVAIYRQEGCDGIISLGGGSSHDCAKAVGILATNPGSINDYAGLSAIRKPLPILMAVTTTSGTGSEASLGAIISDPKRHLKMAIVDPKLLPVVAVNDPILTRTMPPHITAGTAMDAMTHAVEALISKLANSLSDRFARLAIELISENLHRAYVNGDDMEARMNLCYGQYLAGLAMNSALQGNTHSLANACEAQYNLPHGDCNAIILPHILRKNKPASIDKLAKAARSMGVDTTGLSTESAADKAIEAIEALNKQIGIAASITELAERYGRSIQESDVEQIVAHALQDPCQAANPVDFKRQDFEEVCRKAIG